MNKISVVITYYRDVKYIDNILSNVEKFDDNSKVLDVVIWDDGSPENERLDSSTFESFKKVKCKYGEVNRGPYASRLLAMQMTCSSYIWFIDSDDQVIEIPEFMECDIGVFDFNGKEENSLFLTYETGIKFELRSDIISDKSTCVAWNKIFNRRVLEGLPINNFRNGDDLFLTLFALGNSKSIIYVQKPIINYLIRHDSLSRKYKRGRLFELSRVIYHLRYISKINRKESVLLFYNYIFRNYLRSIIRSRNPVIPETLELLRCLNFLF